MHIMWAVLLRSNLKQSALLLTEDLKKKKKSISKGKNDDYECIIFVSRKETNGTLWKPLRKYLNGIFFLIPRSCFETNHCFCP